MAGASSTSARDDRHGSGQHEGAEKARSGGGHGGGHGGAHSGPHAGGSHEEHEGAPEWLISFADNVALMMGFFVVLLAMNMNKQTTGGIGGEEELGGMPQSDRMLDWAISVREAFNNPVEIDSTDPRDQLLVERLRHRAGDDRVPDDGVPGKDTRVRSIRPTDYYSLCGVVPFGEEVSTLSDEARTLAVAAAEKARGRTTIIEVRGHVSATEGFRSVDLAMRLSLERTLAVGRVLAEKGIDWRQIRLVNCADGDRIDAFPDSGASDRANARVEVVVTEETAPNTVPTDPETARQNGDWRQ